MQGEPPQYQSLGTTDIQLITLSIGGGDGYFVPIVKTCIEKYLLTGRLHNRPCAKAWDRRVREKWIRRDALAVGATYVDLVRPFWGREVCTGNPLLNGVVPFNIDNSYHPKVRGQAVIADAIRRALDVSVEARSPRPISS